MAHVAGGGGYASTPIQTTPSLSDITSTFTPTLPTTTTTSTTGSGSSSRSSSGGSGGGGGGPIISGSLKEAFFDWMGRYPTASESNRMANEGWGIDNIRRYAVQNYGSGPAMQELANTIRQLGAPYYNGNPSAIPQSIVDSLIAGGYSEAYIADTYFPMIKGASLDNPLSQPYIDAWVEMTGRPLTYTAMQKLSEFVKAYGYSGEAEAAWVSWVKTTDSAWTGNYGAEQRDNIETTISSILGRHATEAELAPTSTLRDLNEYAMAEALKASPEYEAIYGGKPAWVSEGEWVDSALALNQVFRWYYGDHATVNPDGSITFPTGQYYTEPSERQVGIEAIPTPGAGAPMTEPPKWKSLTAATFKSDLQGLGFTVTGEGSKVGDWTYKLNGQEIPYGQLGAQLNQLAPNTYYEDTQGFHYVQDEGAINPKTGIAATVTKPVATTQYSSTTAAPGGLQNFGATYVVPDLIADMYNNGYTPEMIQQEFIWQEEAAYQQGVYGDTVSEAFGGSGGIDWYTMASGAQGSGAMRARLVEAQNRVAYRETFRQVFGYDPSPSDYDRITSEFVSPGELLREHQAIESADEMYEEVNDLVTRVYGQSVSKEELKDMVLGRPNSGELKALINQATKLDSYRWVHKQYYDSEPTPDDYAKYAGYSGPAELQWEIVTHEKVNEMRDTVNEILIKAGYDPFSDEELTTLYGEQEGYGDLASLYRKAAEEANEIKQAEDWQYSGAEQADIGYAKSGQGGFKISTPGLADL